MKNSIDTSYKFRYILDGYVLSGLGVAPINTGFVASFSTLQQANDVAAIAGRVMHEGNPVTVEVVDNRDGVQVGLQYNYRDENEPGNLLARGIKVSFTFQGQPSSQVYNVGQLILARLNSAAGATEMYIDDAGQLKWKSA